ncbi:MAG TPA: M48 family metalloprotease [Arenicellales bacterium]|nr:M48 family metalloprotease [Arenicellales bacterium]
MNASLRISLPFAEHVLQVDTKRDLRRKSESNVPNGSQLRAPHFNASMYPNGMMHVWSGLLLRAENEAQLAAVIGHEMGHYARRHGLQRFKDRKNKQDFLAFLQLGLAAGGVSEFGDIAYYATLGSMYSFSRDNEREADAIGVRWMASAGYDPLEAPRVWQNVIRETELAGGDASRSFFFSTHPPPSERTETLSAFAQYMHDTEELRGETGRDRYARIVGPWRRLFLEDEVQTKSPRDALALISTLKEGNMSAGDLLFYEGEVYRLRDDEGDLERALSLYQEAIEHRTPPASIHRSLGLVLMKLGRQSAAKVHFKRYLSEKPDAQDSKMIEFTLQQLES